VEKGLKILFEKIVMKKFVVVYRVPVEIAEKWKKETPPEEMKKQDEKLGQDMMAWLKKYDKEIVDKGLPLGKNTRLSVDGVQAVTNDMNYYCVIEGESVDDVVAILKDGGHLMIPGAYMDIMEVPHMTPSQAT
jgi:hypothetical protein